MNSKTDVGDCVIYRATIEHLDELAVLFDGYRQFYRQPSDLDAARQFIGDRLRNEDSVIFVANLSDSGKLVAFTQLYPTFSSVRMQRVWTLNDLFVAESARGQGIARSLMETTRAFAVSTGAVALELATERDNIEAQALYNSLKYDEIDDFLHLALTL